MPICPNAPSEISAFPFNGVSAFRKSFELAFGVRVLEMLTLEFLKNYYRTNGCTCEEPPVMPGAEHEVGCAVYGRLPSSPSGMG